MYVKLRLIDSTVIFMIFTYYHRKKYNMNLHAWAINNIVTSFVSTYNKLLNFQIIYNCFSNVFDIYYHKYSLYYIIHIREIYNNRTFFVFF